MTIRLIGEKELHARLNAIKPDIGLMRRFVVAAVAAQKVLVRRKTGNLGRTIRIGAVTPVYAETVATADYAAAVELGTRPHDIVPRVKKALRWAAKGSATLSGRVRKGGTAIFAKRVRHPGTRPYPFMVPGAEQGVRAIGVQPIEDSWNDAA